MLKHKGAILALCILLLALAGAAWVVSERGRELQAELAKQLEREQLLKDRIAEAQAEEDRRLAAIEAARKAREAALEKAERDRTDAAEALTEKQIADQERDEAALAAERALQLAAEADRRAAAERKKREAEWSRFAAALDKVAPTGRADWELIAELPPDLGLERRSRLAGVFLANQGYRVVIEDGGDTASAEKLQQYLIDAGLPREVLHRASGDRMRLRVYDTILNSPEPPPVEPPLPAAVQKIKNKKASEPKKAEKPKESEPKTSTAKEAAPISSDGEQQYQIQVASVRNPVEAERLAAELRAKKYPVELDTTSREGWTRILVGPLDSRNAAERVQARLRSGGYDTWLQQR